MEKIKKASLFVWNFFSSKSLNIFLLVAASTYAIMLAAWGATSANQIVINISYSLPFKVLFAVFLINNLLCTIKHFPVILKSIAIDKTVPSWQSLIKKRYYITIECSAEHNTLVKTTSSFFSKRFYKIFQSSDKKYLKAVRGRLSPLGNLLFHLSFFLLLTGIIVSSYTRSWGEAVLAEGQTFLGKESDYVSFLPASKFNERHTDFSFQVDKIKPRFWHKRLLFTDLYANLSYPAIEAKGKAVVRLNEAYKPDMFTYVNLTGLGYAPLYRLTDINGREIETAFVNLVTFPPGIEDNFKLVNLPYDIFVKVLPDAVISNNKVRNKSYNLSRPAYLVKVKDKKRIIFKGTLSPNEEVSLEGFKLSFPAIRYWGQFRIIKDNGLFLIFTGFAVALLGLALRFIFIRKEFSFLFIPGKKFTKIYITGSSEYFPHLLYLEIKELAGYLKEL